jgi:hypothetical protein
MTTREEALAAGAARYYDESMPCRKGHRTERYANNGKCVQCVQLMSARRPTKGTGRPGRPPHLSEGRPKSLAAKVATRKSMPLPKLRMADVEPLLVPLIELAPNGCHYPYGEDRFAYRFCGLSKMSSNPYCESHMDISYQPPDQTRERSFLRSLGKAAGLTMPSSLAA